MPRLSVPQQQTLDALAASHRKSVSALKGIGVIENHGGRDILFIGDAGIPLHSWDVLKEVLESNPRGLDRLERRRDDITVVPDITGILPSMLVRRLESSLPRIEDTDLAALDTCSLISTGHSGVGLDAGKRATVDLKGKRQLGAFVVGPIDAQVDMSWQPKDFRDEVVAPYRVRERQATTLLPPVIRVAVMALGNDRNAMTRQRHYQETEVLDAWQPISAKHQRSRGMGRPFIWKPGQCSSTYIFRNPCWDVPTVSMGFQNNTSPMRARRAFKIGA